MQSLPDLMSNCDAPRRQGFICHGQYYSQWAWALDLEVAMTKVMIITAMLASVSLLDPLMVINHLGPQANVVGWKIKTSLDPARMSPQVASLRFW